MLFLCGACGIMTVMLVFTQFISSARRRIMILMEIAAFFLLWFDRLAYVYAGNLGREAFIGVRVSNFMVFFLTSGIVFIYNLYLTDLLKEEGSISPIPKRLKLSGYISACGMLLTIIAAFTGLYYYFDEANRYHRGQGFLIAYIIPVLCPLIQYTVIRQYKKVFSKLIYLSLCLYIFVPIIFGILQIFTYGISIVNMSLVAVSVSMYIFTYLDINREVKRAHEIELQDAEGERKRLKRLFDQTATAFVSAVEKKDDFSKGNAVKIAEYAKKIAKMSGKDEEYCEKAYYTALLHDVGMIGVPDSVIKDEEDPDKWDYEAMRKKPVIGSEILSSITEYPYLSQAARYSHERYNGTGYPEGLKGDQIPEMARLIAVADAYVTMTTPKRYRDARPGFVVRERFIQGAGEEFDPVFADIMVRIIDAESASGSGGKEAPLEKELSCAEYREHVTIGIPVETEVKRISFVSKKEEAPGVFSAPSIILFDAYDRRVHKHEKGIREFHYLEYGELFFDDHMIVNEARKMEVVKLSKTETVTDESRYEIVAGRFEDHMRLEMKGPFYSKEIIIALPDSSKSSYIGITGEHCEIRDISVVPVGKTLGAGDIQRIADVISYTDHLESDLPNIQIDRTRSASTPGVLIDDRHKIHFHTMSLPGASLVWHCPYIILFSSDDGMVGSEGYRELALIKLNGENNGSNEYARNNFIMKKKEEFSGWEDWKAANKEGVDCELSLERKGNKIVLKADTLGIYIENTTTLNNGQDKVYIALTGDQIALTDIWIR